MTERNIMEEKVSTRWKVLFIVLILSLSVAGYSIVLDHNLKTNFPLGAGAFFPEDNEIQLSSGIKFEASTFVTEGLRLKRVNAYKLPQECYPRSFGGVPTTAIIECNVTFIQIIEYNVTLTYSITGGQKEGEIYLLLTAYEIN